MITEEELNKLNKLVRERKACKEFIGELSGDVNKSLEVVDNSYVGKILTTSLRFSQYEGSELIKKGAIEAAEERIQQIDEELARYELRYDQGRIYDLD
jgi:hypothetical protein